MQKITNNMVSEGMMLDVHPSQQKPVTTRKTKNFRVITRGSNSLVLSTIKGNKHKGTLRTDYVPVAIADKNGVAYIISAEVINGEATGWGEIGTFPSPNYDSGDTGLLTNTYRPLRNYAGDNNESPSMNGEFRSEHFDFDLTHILDIELQNDYDGTVNIIFTDGKNPMRIVNSGFTVLPGENYEVIDRSGTKDSNRYTADNFANTIQLIARSTKLMNVIFDGSVTGGILPAGTYQYFFALATSDGNETEIVAQSFGVPVFDGDRISNINGGKNTGDATSKLNKFTLSNLDESYSSLAIYYVISNGMLGEARTAYRIDQIYNINGPSMDFTHTGYENVTRLPITDLVGESPSIDTAETITQSNGYLVAGNIKEKLYDVDSLRKFCRMIKLGHKQVTLDLIGPEEGFSRAFNEPLNQTELKGGTDGFNGGYANPQNVYSRIGYWGGEAYPFAARLIFTDGSKSPLFPAIGIDNVDNLKTSIIEEATESQTNALDATNGFATDGTMLNNLGIYRFPNRTAINQEKLFRMVDSQGRIAVNGVTFQIPDLSTDLGGGKTIKDITIGIQFFRGERRPDVVVQGTMIDCLMVPNIDYDHAGTSEKLWNYANGLYTEDNSKFVPAYGHVLETQHVWDTQSSSDGDRSGEQVFRHGLEPFHLNLHNNDPHIRLNSFKSPFALLSTDIIANPSEFFGISNKESEAHVLYKCTHKATVKTKASTQTEGTANHFSVLVPTSLALKTGTKVYQSKSAFAPEGLSVRNNLKFATEGRFQGRRNFKNDYYLFRNKYNSYLGVRLNATERASEPHPVDDESGDMKLGMLDQEYQHSFLANIYNGLAQKTADNVQDTYQVIDNVKYFPISGKIYWDNTIPGYDPDNTLEGKLDVNRKITLYGGDCFIGHTLRKLYNNAEFSDNTFTNKEEIVRTGYTIGIVNEGNYNVAIRSVETKIVTEGERNHPFGYGSYSNAMGDDWGRGTSWRETRLPESAGYNKGYNMTDGNLLAVTLPLNAPYIQSKWFTRIWTSDKHVPNSFENGYRRFFGRNYKDYPSNYGKITKLIDNNNKLFCIQETGVGAIIIDEKIETANAAGGSVYIDTGRRLSDIQMISKEIGSRHKNSIYSSDNGVYGVMIDRGIIWGFDAPPMRRISDLAIRSYLDEQYTRKAKSSISVLDHDVVAHWDKANDEILFTFYTKVDGGYNNNRCFTVAYNENSKRIHSFYGFIPVKYMNVGDDLYSFSLTDSYKAWQHDSDEVPYCNFYGVQDTAILSVVVNPGPDDKSFSNIMIESNNVMPESVEYRVEGAKASHDISYEKNNILATNAKYRKGFWGITIPKINDVHHQDAEEKIHADYSGSRSSLETGSRVKGKFMIAEITYNTGSVVEIKSVQTIFKSII